MSELTRRDESWHPLGLPPAEMSSGDKVQALLSYRDLPRRVKELSPQNVLMLIQDIGANDAMFIFDMTSADQMRGMLDLTIWEGAKPNYQKLMHWMSYAGTCSDQALGRLLFGSDPELLMGLIMTSARIYHRPDWDEDETLQGELIYSPDRLFVLEFEPTGNGEKTDVQLALERALKLLYQKDVEYARKILINAVADQVSELEETQYRFRTGRLEDLGFLPYDEALGLYSPLPVEQLKVLIDEEIEQFRPRHARAGDALAAFLIPYREGRFLTRVLRRLDDEGQRQFHTSLTYLVNRSLVARAVPLHDVQLAREEVEWVLRHLNIGLARLSDGDEVKAERIATHTTLFNVFRTAVSLLVPLAERSRALLKRLGADLGYRLLTDDDQSTLEGLASNWPVRLLSPEVEPFRTLEEVKQAEFDIARLEQAVSWMEQRLGFTPRVLESMAPEHGDELIYLSFPLLLATLIVHHETDQGFQIGPLTASQVRTVVGRWFADGPTLSAGARKQLVERIFGPLTDGPQQLESEWLTHLLHATFTFLENELGHLDPTESPDPRGLPIGFLKLD